MNPNKKTTLLLAIVLIIGLVVLAGLVIALIPKECTHFACDKTPFSPTCDTKGYTLYQCKDCEYTFEADFVAPLGHTFTDETVEPTCDTEGYTAHTCSVCGIVDKDKYVRPTGHDYKETVYAPKCETQGYTLHECKNCEFSIKSDYVKPTGHVLKSKTTNPTCNEQGYTVHSCENCSYTYTNDYTEPKGHTYSKSYVRPNIEKTGYTKYKCNDCGASHIADFVFYSDIFTGAAGSGRGEIAWGLDISKWSKQVDFVKLKELGVDFVIIRVGSYTNKDPYFEEYYAAAKAAGLDVGAYFFTYSESKAEAIADAKRVAGWLEGKQFEYPIFFDIEDDENYDYYPSKFSKELITDMAHGFMTTMVEEGYYPGLYINNDMLYDTFNSEKALRLYDVWYARYPATQPTLAEIKANSSIYSMWQYMGRVKSFGNGAVEGECDINYAFKDYPTWIKKHHLNGY